MRPLLLDTMTVLWVCFRPDFLGKSANQILTSTESSLRYSIVNLWEIAIKKSKGGYREFVLPDDWERVIPEYLEGMSIVRREITPHHCRRIQELPNHHKDPFDRMLISQALEDGCDMISKDEMVERYGVRRVW